MRRDVIWTAPCGLHLVLHHLVRPRDTCSCRTLISTMVSKPCLEVRFWGLLVLQFPHASKTFLLAALLMCALVCVHCTGMPIHVCPSAHGSHGYDKHRLVCRPLWHRRQGGSVCVSVPSISSDEANATVIKQAYRRSSKRHVSLSGLGSNQVACLVTLVRQSSTGRRRGQEF